MDSGIVKAIMRGTAIAGTLDIVSAFIFAGLAGATPLQVLRSVAAGPFGNGMAKAGIGGALAGLSVHFAIMAVIVTAFAVVASRVRLLLDRPWLTGVAAGLIVYLVMYWIVLPARWPAVFPKTELWSVANALFSMICCVGIPIALVTAASFRRN